VSAASAPALSSQLIVAMATAPHTWLRLVPSCRSYSKATRLYKIDYPWKDEPKPHWVRQFEARRVDADLTPENRDWLRQWRLQRVRDAVASSSEAARAASPLKAAACGEAARCGLVGIKLGILPMWYRNGQKVHTTVVQIPDQRVLRWVPPEDLGKLVGAVPADPRQLHRQWCGIFKAAGLPPMRKISRFLVSTRMPLCRRGPVWGCHHFRCEWRDCVDWSLAGQSIAASRASWSRPPDGRRHLRHTGSTKFHRKMGSADRRRRADLPRQQRIAGVDGQRFGRPALPALGGAAGQHQARLAASSKVHSLAPHSYCQIMDSWMLDVRRLACDANPPPMPTYFAEDAPEGGYPRRRRTPGPAAV
uniref:Large ribosomal subunit protein uL3m n=1 Tax=Macrostomum lignano TaxID=282301 RepID=A0A1I8FNQ0_9PLAT